MKLEFKLNWAWVLMNLRISILLSIFYILYVYTKPVFAFIWIGYIILSELAEIIDDIERMEEERSAVWTSILNKRKGF